MVSAFLALLERDARRGYAALVSPGSFEAQCEAQRRARDAELADAEPDMDPEPTRVRFRAPTPTPRGSQIVFDVGTTLAEIESAAVRQTLDAVSGNKSKAARLLGIDRRTFYRMLKAAA